VAGSDGLSTRQEKAHPGRGVKQSANECSELSPGDATVVQDQQGGDWRGRRAGTAGRPAARARGHRVREHRTHHLSRSELSPTRRPGTPNPSPPPIARAAEFARHARLATSPGPVTVRGRAEASNWLEGGKLPFSPMTTRPKRSTSLAILLDGTSGTRAMCALCPTMVRDPKEVSCGLGRLTPMAASGLPPRRWPCAFDPPAQRRVPPGTPCLQEVRTLRGQLGVITGSSGARSTKGKCLPKCVHLPGDRCDRVGTCEQDVKGEGWCSSVRSFTIPKTRELSGS